MKMKRWIRKIVPIVSAVMLMLSGSISVYADENTGSSGSLTVEVSYNDVSIQGAAFAIYKVQQWENPQSGPDPVWCGEFTGFSSKIGSLRNFTAEKLLAAAESLEDYIEENNISADKTGTTGTNGHAVFSSLDPGVYLVIVTQQPKGYEIMSPFLVTVPKLDKDGHMNYSVTVEPKIEPSPRPTPSATPGPTSPPTPGPTNPPPVRTPEPTNPPPGPTDPPPATPAPSTTPAPPATPAPTDPPPQPTEPPRITNRPSPTPTPDQAVLGMRRRRGWEKGVLGRRRLPQTGTLQWPIPVLAGTGILLFFIGWMRRYGKKNKPEDGSGSKKKMKGMLLMSVGPLMIVGGMGILLYNNWDNTRAEKAAEHVLAQIEQNAEQAKEAKAADNSAISEKIEEKIDTTMSTIEVDGFTYIGEVAIPAIDISLPVMNSVTSEGLKIAPGRYEGNYKENSLIIAAHNYQRHFGNIKYLSPGDQVVFLDVDGTEYFYEVAEIETVGGKKVSKMSEGDWDLTLFTCTYGGRNRVTVRCNLQEEA